MTIRILMFVLSSLGMFSSPAFAGELDNETKVVNEQALRGQDLPQTVVIRVNESTGEAGVLEVSARLNQDPSHVSALHSASFKSITGTQELNRSSSTSSWFAWYNSGYFYAPTYYYYGFSYVYSNWWQYSYYGYSYYWYRWY